MPLSYTHCDYCLMLRVRQNSLNTFLRASLLVSVVHVYVHTHAHPLCKPRLLILSKYCIAFGVIRKIQKRLLGCLVVPTACTLACISSTKKNTIVYVS